MANVTHSPTDIDQYGTPVLASAARTATPDTQEFELPADTDQLILSINVTALTATGTLVVKVEGVDIVAGATFLLATTGTISATGEYTVAIGPSLPVSASNPAVTNNVAVPRVVRITATHGNSVSITYSVEMQLG